MQCPALSFFHSQEFLKTVLHTAFVLGIPFYILGGYCILFKTPDQMTSVKKSMFNLHFWSTTMDVFISVLTAPFVLLPSMSGVPLGILSFLGVGVPVQVYLVLTVIALTGVAILHIFENRHHKMIFESSRPRNAHRFLYFLLNYTLALSFTIPTILLIPDQERAKTVLLAEYPCQFEPDRFFVVALDITVTHFFTTATSLIIEAQIAFFVVRLLIQLRIKDFHRSQRTRNLQKRLFFAICIQVTVPIFLMFIPFLYICLGIPLGYHNQALNNVSVGAVSVHGLLSTVVMLIVHKPYRDATLRLLNAQKIISRSSGNTAQIPLHVITV